MKGKLQTRNSKLQRNFKFQDPHTNGRRSPIAFESKGLPAPADQFDHSLDDRHRRYFFQKSVRIELPLPSADCVPGRLRIVRVLWSRGTARPSLLQELGITGGGSIDGGNLLQPHWSTRDVSCHRRPLSRQRFRDDLPHPVCARSLHAAVFLEKQHCRHPCHFDHVIWPHVCAVAFEFHSEDHLLSARRRALLPPLFYSD